VSHRRVDSDRPCVDEASVDELNRQPDGDDRFGSPAAIWLVDDEMIAPNDRLLVAGGSNVAWFTSDAITQSLLTSPSIGHKPLLIAVVRTERSARDQWMPDAVQRWPWVALVELIADWAIGESRSGNVAAGWWRMPLMHAPFLLPIVFDAFQQGLLQPADPNGLLRLDASMWRWRSKGTIAVVSHDPVQRDGIVEGLAALEVEAVGVLPSRWIEARHASTFIWAGADGSIPSLSERRGNLGEEVRQVWFSDPLSVDRWRAALSDEFDAVVVRPSALLALVAAVCTRPD
jgi:hypothetical protein